MITIKNKVTGRTMVFPLAKLFLDTETTPRAVLTGVPGVHENYRPTSFFRFVGCKSREQVPGYIRDALGEPSVLTHFVYRQVFKNNGTVVVNEVSTNFVSKISSLVGYFFVNAGHGFSSELSFCCTFFGTREPSLNLSQSFLRLTEETRILYHFSLVGGEKTFQTNVNTHGGRKLLQLFSFLYLNNKTNKPFSCTRPFNGCGFDLALYRSVKVEFDGAYFSNLEVTTFKLSSTGVLRKGYGVITPKTFKTGVTDFVFSIFNTAEKVLKSKVYTALYILKNLTVNFLEDWFLLFPVRQHLVGIEQAKRFSLFFPSSFTKFQGEIVNLSTDLQPSVQSGSLTLGRVQPVLESFNNHVARG